MYIYINDLPIFILFVLPLFFFVIDAVVAHVIQFPVVIYAKKDSFSLFYLSRILRFCSKSYYPSYIEVFFLAFIISLTWKDADWLIGLLPHSVSSQLAPQNVFHMDFLG